MRVCGQVITPPKTHRTPCCPSAQTDECEDCARFARREPDPIRPFVVIDASVIRHAFDSCPMREAA